jgi:type IV pilus assembly protein PilX
MKSIRPQFARQKGTTLLVAMVALVAMMTAGMALIRSVDSANLAASNFQMQQSAEQNLDLALNEAMLAYMRSHPNAGLNMNNKLGNDLSVSYRAVRPDTDPAQNQGIPTALLNLSAPAWNANGPVATGTWPGEQVDLQSKQLRRYLVERLCRNGGFATVNHCQMYEMTFGSYSERHGGDEDEKETLPFIRITARVDGPKGAVSYAQLFMKGH